MTNEQKACREVAFSEWFKQKVTTQSEMPSLDEAFLVGAEWQSTQQPTPTEQIQDGSTLNLSGQAGLIAEIESIRPSADAPELSERAYRQACDDCIALIRQHLQKGNPMPNLIDADLLVETLKKEVISEPENFEESGWNEAFNFAIALIQSQAAAPSGVVEALDDVQLIRNTVGDLETGLIGTQMRGNIGGIVTRACDRLETYLTSPAPKQQPDVTDTNVGDMPEVAGKPGFATGEQPAKDDEAVDITKTVFSFKFVPSPALSNLNEAVFRDAQGVELGRITDISLRTPQQPTPLDLQPMTEEERQELVDELGCQFQGVKSPEWEPYAEAALALIESRYTLVRKL